MTDAEQTPAAAVVNRDDAAEMAEYGITRVPAEYFHFKEYRYTNLDDAIAQAKRGRQHD